MEARDRAAAAQADFALSYARDDPQRARAEAEEALRLARVEDDPAAAAVAERALGLAARTGDDLATAMRHLRRAVRIAERHGLGWAAAQARVSLFGTLALRGEFAAALKAADRAAVGLRGVDRARLEMQRATVLMMQGVRLDEALDALRQALPLLRRAGEKLLEADLLSTRGLVQCYRGELAAAEADLRAAERLHRSLGHERIAATDRQNLGFVAARRGDLPAALAWFDRADVFFRTRGLVDAMGLRDRSEALLGARLVVEARRTAEEAVTVLAGQGVASHLAEARLMLAEAALLDGDPATARSAADHAARAFARQRRPHHRQLAGYLKLKADWQAGERSDRMLRAARRSAQALEAFGWVAPAQDARLIAGRLALELGRPVIARDELTAASRKPRRGPVELRIRAREAEALLRASEGDTKRAARALRSGMRLLEQHRALLGATDLRTHASAHGAELAEMGLRMAVCDGTAAGVLEWAERWRAGSLASRPVRPPDDERLQSELAQLRQVVREVEQAALEGRRLNRLLQRQAQLERSVRDLARHASGSASPAVWSSADRRALTEALGDLALVEFAELDGGLYAVTAAGRRWRLTSLGPVDRVVAENEALRFALGRLAHRHGSMASQAAAAAAFEHGRRALDELLFAPLSAEVGDRPLVIVPTGQLHVVPWSALPSLAGRPVTVAPSARLWQRVTDASAHNDDLSRTVLAAGPDVTGAGAEISALRAIYPDATCLTGKDAQVQAVAGALDGAELGHLVAHGRFRVDNPLFSSLRLSDGPLTVYDVEALTQPPHRLVLSACDAGLTDVRAGDELRGLVAALFMLGTRSVIAAATPVPDAATLPLMVALHRALAAGDRPATALARAQAGLSDTVQERAAAAGFVCFGAA